MKSLTDYMYNPFLNKASDSAKCLSDLGIDPSTVAQLSPDAQKVFNYDPDLLSKRHHCLESMYRYQSFEGMPFW